MIRMKINSGFCAIVMLLIVLATGCVSNNTGVSEVNSYYSADAIAKRRLPVQPYRNTQIPTKVDWRYDFQPADNNSAIEFSMHRAPQLVRDALNQKAVADGNSFYESAAGSGQVTIYITASWDRNVANPHNSLRADVCVEGHQSPCFTVRTISYANNEDMIDDLATQIYYYFHEGWHYN
jgi:hypothetical protein